MMASSSSSLSGVRAYRPGVWFTEENFGKIFLRNTRGFTAEISFYGGQVTSWKNERGEELLFLSKKAVYKERELIRGGIPICFPKIPDHGLPRDMGAFATHNMWATDVESSSLHTKGSNDQAYIDLILKPLPHTYFPHKFELRLNVYLNPAGKLLMTTRVRNNNTNGKPFSFTFAYHTYLSVSDIREVRVEDLETMHYLDNLQNKQRFTEQDLSITFESEVDRAYLSTPNRVAVMDHRKRRTIIIRKNGLPDVVVWNPWDKKAKAMTDFANDEYNRMLCVGPASVETPITLRPGQEWTGVQELAVEDF